MTAMTGLHSNRRFYAVWLGTAVLIAGIIAWRLLGHPEPGQSADQASPAVPVVAGVASTIDVPDYVQGLGTVQAYNTVVIRTRVDGPITQVLFNEGQEVAAGDPLFKIDPITYQAQLDQAVAKKGQDEALLANARRDLDRYTRVGTLAVSQQQIDTQRSLVAQDEALVKLDQAAINNVTALLGFTNIVAPFAGRTGARLVDIGNLVQAAQATSLVSLTQLKPIFVVFTAPQSELDQIRTNQSKAPLAVDAYSGDDKTLLAHGKLALIDNQIDPTTGTIRLKAQFDNADERLWPGEFVNVRLIVSQKEQAITVPAQTVMQGSNGYFAYIIRPGNTVERRDVTVAKIQDGLAVVNAGIAAGEQVVVDGQYRLVNNARVRIDTGPQTKG